jgi:hypothetical protein
MSDVVLDAVHYPSPDEGVLILTAVYTAAALLTAIPGHRRAHPGRSDVPRDRFPATVTLLPIVGTCMSCE